MDQRVRMPIAWQQDNARLGQPGALSSTLGSPPRRLLDKVSPISLALWGGQTRRDFPPAPNWTPASQEIESASPCPLGCGWPRGTGSWVRNPRFLLELGFMGRNAGLGHHFWVPISVLLQTACMTLGQILPCSSSASCL